MTYHLYVRVDAQLYCFSIQKELRILPEALAEA